MDDTINSASGITESAPMTGVGQVSSTPMDLGGGDAPIRGVTVDDVGQTPSPTSNDGLPTVHSVSVDEGSGGNVKSAMGD